VENVGLKEQLAVAQSQLTFMENERSEEQARRVAEDVEKSKEVSSAVTENDRWKWAQEHVEIERQENAKLVKQVIETRNQLRALKKSSEEEVRKAAEQVELSKYMGARGAKAAKTWADSAIKKEQEKIGNLRQQLQAAQSDVATARKERDEARAGVAAMGAELNEARSSSTALEEKLRLAHEGLQVAAWEERLKAAETQCEEATQDAEEVRAENEILQDRTAVAEANSTVHSRGAYLSLLKVKRVEKKLRSAEEDYQTSEREGDACLKSLQNAVAQNNDLEEQIATIASTDLERDVNDVLTAKNAKIASLRKLVRSHDVVLALTGTKKEITRLNKEITGLKGHVKALEDELEQFYKRAHGVR